MANEKKVLIYDTVQDILRKLHVDENPLFKQMRVRLRHSVDKEMGEDPELFGWLADNIPHSLQNSGGGLSYEEKAIYTALTLFPNGPKDKKDGRSIAAAAKAAEPDIKRSRLSQIESAKTLEEARKPLTSMMKLLKAKGQSIDYGTLACDLCELQYDNTRTTRRWERDYARKEKKE